MASFPPCQPYTRQGDAFLLHSSPFSLLLINYVVEKYSIFSCVCLLMILSNFLSGLQKQSNDPRAFSFLNILELIPDLSQLPTMLFIENVVGFEVCS